MNKTLKNLSFLAILLVAFALTLPQTVHASSDPSRWTTKPSNYYNSGFTTLSDPEDAYDNVTTTYADIKCDTTGRFEVIDFTIGAQTSGDIIAMVDLYMTYDHPGGGCCQYKIWYYVSSTYEASPSTSSTLVNWCTTKHNEATDVWKDIKDPSDLTWSWSDISKIRVVVQSGYCGGGGAKYFEEHEVWLKVYYYNKPTLYVDPPSTTKNVGESFSVDINITDFTAGNWSGGVYGWEFKLGYDGTKLNASNIVCNGTGKYLNTGWYYRINWSDTLGLVWYTCTLMGHVEGKSGDGILATITFNVKATGSCTLDLHGTKLSGYDYPNTRIYPISHTAVDGAWQSAAVPEFPYGAALEIALAVVIVYAWWTRRRKKKPTNYSQPPLSSACKT